MTRLAIAALAFVVAAGTTTATRQTRGLKVFISVDMEGLAGVVSGNDVKQDRPLYKGAERVGPGASKFSSPDFLEILNAFNAMK